MMSESNRTLDRSRLRRMLPYLLAYFAVMGFWLSYAAYGFNLWDECVLAYGGWRVLHGQMVWVDFFGYAPGRYLLAALLYSLLEPSLWTLRLGFHAMTAVMPLLAFAIGRRLMPARWALLPAVILTIAPCVYYFRSFPFVAVLGGWSLCQLMEAPSPRRQILHGAILFVCTMLESAAGGFIVVLTPVALWFSAGPWMSRPSAVLGALLRIFGASLIAALPVLGFYAWHGRLLEAASLQAYRYVVTGASMWVAYPRPWDALLGQGWSEIRWQDFLQDSLFWATGGMLAGASVLVWFQRGPRLAPEGSSPAADRLVPLLCLLGWMNFLLPLYRAGFYNVLRASPMPWILGSFLLYRLVRRGGLARVVGLGGLAYPALLALHLFTHAEYRTISTGSPPGAALRSDLVWLDDPRAGIWVERRQEELIRTVQGWIRAMTREGDPILAVPLNPLFYWFGRRDNPTAHDYILPGYWRDAQQIAEALQEIDHKPPELFLYCDLAVDGQLNRRFPVYSAPIYEYFVRRYARTERFHYNGINFWAFRRLKPALHWPADPSQAEPAVSAEHGPVRRGIWPGDATGIRTWRLLPGSGVQIQATHSGRQVLLFRGRGLGGPSLPRLELSVGGQRRRLAVEVIPAPQVPPWTGIVVDLQPGDSVQLELRAESLEQLTGEVHLLQPTLLPEAEVFTRILDQPAVTP